MNQHLVCRVKHFKDAGRPPLEFTWSVGSACFEPIRLDHDQLQEFEGKSAAARRILFGLVAEHAQPEGDRDAAEIRRGCKELAGVGWDLYNLLLPINGPHSDVREWLDELARRNQARVLEIVCDGDPWSAPWNLVYDEDPEDDRFDHAGAGLAPFEAFWGVRYNLASSLPVNPLRSIRLPEAPDVLMVIDPIVEESLKDHPGGGGASQHDRLVEFMEAAKAAGARIRRADSKDSLKRAFKAGRPDVMYWLCHADPGMLQLGADKVTLADLNGILRPIKTDRATSGLVILNACQTAQREAGVVGSFLKSFHDHNYCGIVATEERTLDTFANPFGLALLRGFLNDKEPIGRLLRTLRRRNLPLGLLYGTYCPAHLEVGRPEAETAEAEPLAAVSLPSSRPAAALGVAHSDDSGRWPPLPEDLPYLPLGVYGPEHRALFAGRDSDVVRFAMLLDHAPTRVLVLHGESGAGKSSFLRAGVIPYLEDECVGYRFLRERGDDEPAYPVLFVRSTDDPLGQLAEALVAFCRRPFRYATPTGRDVSVDLPARLASSLGRRGEVGPTELRAALRDDPAALKRLLAAISDGLPFTPGVVIDQAEEMFTLFDAERADSTRDELLDGLRRVAGEPGDFKVILSLRTEYYGRLVDRLRRGVAEAHGVREYLLTDLDLGSLIEAIRRPTEDRPIRYSGQAPRDVYGFRYEDGVAEIIARDLIREGRRDGVLPLAQFLCDQLYRRAKGRPDAAISEEDYRIGIGGVVGGLRRHLERQLDRLAPGRAGEQRAIQELLSRLSHRQADGTMTTDLVREAVLAQAWKGSTAFPDLLEQAEALRLLRFSTRRDEDGMEERSISLGHDALARVAAAWQAERDQQRKLRRLVFGAVAMGSLALVFAFGALLIYGQNLELGRANIDLEIATRHAESEAVRSREAEKEARDVLAFVQEKILAAARPEGKDGGLGREVTLRKALEIALPEIESSFQGRPAVEAAVRMALGRSFALLGDHGVAERQFEDARELYRVHLGPDHPDTLASMANLASSYADSGRLAEALTLDERTLALRRAKLGPDHPDTLASMANLARSLAALDRTSEAVILIDGILESTERRGLLLPCLPLVLNLRLQTFARLGDALGCRRSAEPCERLACKDAIGFYDAARCRAVTAKVMLSDARTPDAAACIEADKAMDWIAKAVDAGYRTPQNIARMARDPDLDALRDRSDFRRLLGDLLDQQFPEDPFAP